MTGKIMKAHRLIFTAVQSNNKIGLLSANHTEVNLVSYTINVIEGFHAKRA